MVTIQPFEYEKTTAFKERVQIANKVNEIINLFNELDIESKINVFNEEIVIINGKITEINNALNEVNTAVNTVEGYNTRLTSVENESISLDARLDNLETKDLENVKLSGNQTIENIKTFSNSPIVPNPPSGDTSTKAVNTNWISQTGNNAPNNLIHKNGDESKTGKLTLNDTLIFLNERWETTPFTIYKWAFDSIIPPTKFETINGGFEIRDINNRKIWRLWAYRDTNGRDVLSIDGYAYDDTTAYIHFEVGPNGYRKINTNFDKPSNW